MQERETPDTAEFARDNDLRVPPPEGGGPPDSEAGRREGQGLPAARVRLLQRLSVDCGVSLSDEAVSSEGLYD
jgi:hypothetical protein